MTKQTNYRFSPIENKEALLEAVNYVTRQATKMIFSIEGWTCPIKYVTIFAHYDDEYHKLLEIVSELGDRKELDNGVVVTLKEPLIAPGMTLDVNGKIEEITHRIERIRIRMPDPYRMQVGCADYDFENDLKGYEFLVSAEADLVQGIKLIERPDKEMVEFSDPDYDVLGYVVEPSDK